MTNLPEKSVLACRWRGKASAVLGSVVSMLGLVACSSPTNPPSNLPLIERAAPIKLGAPLHRQGRTGIILALSGGGARSAAFGFGVLSELAEQASPDEVGRTMADDVVAVAGVSGGGILAAHFALYGPQGLPAFRRDYLDQDVETSLRTAFTPENLARGYRGGVNDLGGFGTWLDRHLYHSATLGDLDRAGQAKLILHATELDNRAPFPFDRASFRALCSDFDSFPLAHAVAASAAVPVVFAPVVLENFNADCPVAVAKAQPTRENSAFADHVLKSRARYASAPDLRYLKLLDGGLVDNLAIRNVIRTMSASAPSPMTAAMARQLRRVVVIVTDASMRSGDGVSKTIDGPTAPDTVTAAVDAMVDSASRASLDALAQESRRWRDRVIRWRCNAKQAMRDCDRFEVDVIRISLSDLSDGAERARVLQLHNKLSLKAEDVDFLAGLGRRLIRHAAVSK